MRKVPLITFTLFIFSLKVAASPSELRFNIQSKYKLNKKIWGTYKQIWEVTSLKNKKELGKKINKKKKYHLVHKPLGTILFKHKKMYFMKSSFEVGRTELKVEKFSYKKLVNRKNNIKYEVESENLDENLYSIYKDRIHHFLESNPELYGKMAYIDKKYFDFGDMNCQRKKKIIFCNISVSIKVNEYLNKNQAKSDWNWQEKKSTQSDPS